MAEQTMLWPTGGVNDALNPYTDTQTRAMFKSIVGEGVQKGDRYNLAPTCAGNVSPVAVNTGSAWIQGYWYENTASKDIAITTPAATTGFRIVVRLDFVGHVASVVTPVHDTTLQSTGRIILTMSEDGTADIPAEEQTGNVWDFTLATGAITSGGVVTLTDARTYCNYHGEVLAANIADNAVAAAKIVNRTRTFFVPATKTTTAAGTCGGYPSGSLMCWSGGTFEAIGFFIVPNDYASGMTVKAILYLADSDSAPASPAIRVLFVVNYGAVGEDEITHINSIAETTYNLNKTETLQTVSTATLTSAAAGDIVGLDWIYDSADPLSNMAGTFLYFQGFLVEYTADS